MDDKSADLPAGEKFHLLPVDFRSQQATEIVNKIKSRVIGQDDAIAGLHGIVECVLANPRDPSRPNKPMAVVILLGPSGVGKTEAARAFTEAMLGAPDRMFGVDCSGLSKDHELSALKGSPPGYIGSNEQPGLSQFYLDAGYLKCQAESGEYFTSRCLEIEKQLEDIEHQLFELQQDVFEKKVRQDAYKEKLKELQGKPESERIDPEKEGIIFLTEGIAVVDAELAQLKEGQDTMLRQIAYLRGRMKWFKSSEKAPKDERLKRFALEISDQNDIKLYNQNPDPNAFSVLLLDEIEKADEALSRLLLGVFDNGELQLMNGGKTIFKNTVIFLTSNLGDDEVKKLFQSFLGNDEGAIGFTGHKETVELSVAHDAKQKFHEAVKGACLGAFHKYFPPPFVRRVTQRICFQPLAFPDMLAILGRFIRDFNNGAGRTDRKMSVSIPMKLIVSKELKELIIQKASVDWEEGAGRIDGFFRECVIAPLMALVNGCLVKPYDMVFAKLHNGRAVFYSRPGELPPNIKLLGPTK